MMVMESVADALVAMVNEKIAQLKVGLPEDNADITAVISESSADFIQVCAPRAGRPPDTHAASETEPGASTHGAGLGGGCRGEGRQAAAGVEAGAESDLAAAGRLRDGGHAPCVGGAVRPGDPSGECASSPSPPC